MIRRFSQYSLRKIGISRRDFSNIDAVDEDPTKWIPAPKGIEACKLHQNPREELGQLKFKYNASSFHNALAESRNTEKPVLIVFHELSGSADAITFGKTVLSHPLLIEAAESMFVTMFVDMAGTNPDDVQIISRYHENRHNDTVVRIVNGNGKDLAVRLEGRCCSVGKIARAMREALERKNLQVPTYLKFLETEYLARVHLPSQASRGIAKEIVFKTEAATKAEIDFAELDGIIDVECGNLCGSRAVKVTYNSEVIDCKAILLHAIFHLDVDTVYWTNWYEMMAMQSDLEMDAKPNFVELGSSTFTRGKNPKNFLRTTLLRYVPLTSLQALQANLAISKNHREVALNILSPRQLAILEAVERKIPRRETVDVGISEAWKRLARDGVFDWS
jgi:hypothetical protein